MAAFPSQLPVMRILPLGIKDLWEQPFDHKDEETPKVFCDLSGLLESCLV